jgi:hypothetical protein
MAFLFHCISLLFCGFVSISSLWLFLIVMICIVRSNRIPEEQLVSCFYCIIDKDRVLNS